MANLPKDTIEGYLVFTSISKPKLKYKSEKDFEYGVTVVLSKEDAKEFKKRKLNKTVKEVDSSEFLEKYKIDPPFPDQDEQYLVTITQNVTKTNGDPLPDFLRPQAYLKVEGGNELITDKEIANGSYGTVRYSQRDGDKGISIKLDAVQLTTFIPYVSANVDEWAGSVVNRPATSNQVAAKTVVAPPSTTKVAVDADIDDLPF